MARRPVADVPEGDAILRYVPPSRLRRDADSRPIGVLYAAFELRPGEKYLSAAWLDFYPGDRATKLTSAVAAYDPTPLTIKDSGGFAIGVVKAVKAAGTRFGHSFRIVHDQEHKLDSYVAVRRFPQAEQELLDLLATEAWSEMVLVKDCR